MLNDIGISKAQRDDVQSNRLLGALETASRKRIDPHLEPIKLKLGAIVCEAGASSSTPIFRRAASSHF
jgi:hypothetical protein